MNKHLLWTVIITLTASTGCAAQASWAKRISLKQARVLVMACLTPNEKGLPRLGIEPYQDPNSPRFIFFAVTWSGTAGGSVVVGNYAVDPYTGDVFSATIACHQEKNRVLEAAQRQIRASLDLTPTKYQELKTNGPLCEK